MAVRRKRWRITLTTMLSRRPRYMGYRRYRRLRGLLPSLRLRRRSFVTLASLLPRPFPAWERHVTLVRRLTLKRRIRCLVPLSKKGKGILPYARVAMQVKPKILPLVYRTRRLRTSLRPRPTPLSRPQLVGSRSRPSLRHRWARVGRREKLVRNRNASCRKFKGNGATLRCNRKRCPADRAQLRSLQLKIRRQIAPSNVVMSRATLLIRQLLASCRYT